MSKYAGPDRIVAERIATAKQALGITVSGIYVGDTNTASGDVRLATNWVKVHLDELLDLGRRVADCEARVVAAEEQRTQVTEAAEMWQEQAARWEASYREEAVAAARELAVARAQTESVRRQWGADVARADKAQRELAEACAQIATLNRAGGA
jgi:chromosome segregation ATPase